MGKGTSKRTSKGASKGANAAECGSCSKRGGSEVVVASGGGGFARPGRKRASAVRALLRTLLTEPLCQLLHAPTAFLRTLHADTREPLLIWTPAMAAALRGKVADEVGKIVDRTEVRGCWRGGTSFVHQAVSTEAVIQGVYLRLYCEQEPTRFPSSPRPDPTRTPPRSRPVPTWIPSRSRPDPAHTPSRSRLDPV